MRFLGSRWLRLGMTTRILALSLAALVVAVAALGTLRATSEIQQADQRRLERLTARLALFEALLASYGGTVALEGDTLKLGGTVLNGRNDITDIVGEGGMVATIFAGDRRVATSVRRPDGTRAVGTTLAAGPAHEASIGRGETYLGRNTILGQDYTTIYKPLREAGGRQVGLLFVGIPMADSIAARDAAIRDALVGGLALAVVMGGVIALVVLATLRPLRRLIDQVVKVGAGQTDEVPQGQERGDEVGRLARAIEALRHGVADAFQSRQMLDTCRAAWCWPMPAPASGWPPPTRRHGACSAMRARPASPGGTWRRCTRAWAACARCWPTRPGFRTARAWPWGRNGATSPFRRCATAPAPIPAPC